MVSTTPFQSFIIGTSILVALPHLYTVGFLRAKEFSFDFNTYCLLAPLYFGLLNALGNWLGKVNNWTLRQRLWRTSLLSVILIITIAYFYNRQYYLPYSEYQLNDWVQYAIRNGLMHIFVFNVIIYGLECSFR